jgi:hypothetical protein
VFFSLKLCGFCENVLEREDQTICHDAPPGECSCEPTPEELE